MNYQFATPSPYMHAAMSQAVQAMMSAGPLPPNCVIMAMPFQQAQQILPQLMMNPGMGIDPMIYSQPTSYYGPSPYVNNLPPHPLPSQQNYNYPIVPYKNSKKKSSSPLQPHSNIYNSSSFDSYMHHLSWSRLFDRPSRKNSKQGQTTGNQQKSKSNSSSSSSSSTSSTTSDETIRRVNVTNKPSSSSNIDSKQQTKGSLPFKYSSEFIPGIGKQQSQKIKSNDVFIVKKQ